MTDKHVARLKQIQQMQPSYDVKSGIQTQAILMRGKCNSHYDIPFPHNN